MRNEFTQIMCPFMIIIIRIRRYICLQYFFDGILQEKLVSNIREYYEIKYINTLYLADLILLYIIKI